MLLSTSYTNPTPLDLGSYHCGRKERKASMSERDDRDAAVAQRTLDDLPAGLLSRVVDHLRTVEPAAIGVLVTGSYAAGRASLQSDLDATVLTAVPPQGAYRTWFEPRPGTPLHVSAGAEALAAAGGEDEHAAQ